jgi:hypothetical protein
LEPKTLPAPTLLRPLLDMFLDSSVAVVGCAARGFQRGSCELDVVVVGSENRPQTSVKIGGVLMDLMFMTENYALKPSNPEHAVSMAYARPVRDATLVLSTSTAANSAMLQESCRSASGTRLASALKTLGRAEDALSKESAREADFWLLAASYEFAYAWAYSKELLPSPSHLLSQLKGLSKGTPKYFEAVSKGAGLEKSTRAGCGSRLEGLVVLHDLVQGRARGQSPAHSSWSPVRLEIVRAKAEDLASKIELAECYSFLGQELVDYMMVLTSMGGGGTRLLAEVLSGDEPLLADRLVRSLGLSRKGEAIQRGLDQLRDQVSGLARKV